MEPEEMMVGGAMFPQCLPRRSADSLSPSRISMKSYLRGDREKDTDEQSDHSDHSEGLGRTVLPLWLSPFFRRHSGAAVSTKGTLLALVHRQTQTREVVFKLHRVSARVRGLISGSQERSLTPSGSQSKRCLSLGGSSTHFLFPP